MLKDFSCSLKISIEQCICDRWKALFTNEAKYFPPSNKSTPAERETLALTVPRSLWLWKASNWTAMGPRLLLLLIVLFSAEAKAPKCDKSEYLCMLWTIQSPWPYNLCRICGEDLRGRVLHLHLHKEGEKVMKTHFRLMFTFSQIQVETSLQPFELLQGERANACSWRGICLQSKRNFFKFLNQCN